MSIRNAIAVGLLATASTFALSPAHAVDAPKKDPATGKNCVIYYSSEMADPGRLRMNYRNICADAFAIMIQTGEGVRKSTIEAGTPEKPSRAHVTCQLNDRCENSKWVYE